MSTSRSSYRLSRNSGLLGGGDLAPRSAAEFAISGFATTFEILQTYQPTANEISFRVPYMPEGFQFADYFDTYYGNLRTVGD